MSITIEIDRALELSLREDAARKGLSVDQVIANFLERYISTRNKHEYNVSKREAELLQKVSLDISEATWLRYHELKEKLSNRTLTETELTEFQQINDQIEAANNARLSVLAELARLRQVPLRQLLKDLGLNTEPHE